MNHWSLSALGMGTVFIALIGLALVVSLFPLIFRKPEKKRKDPAPLPSLTSAAPAPAASAPSASATKAAGPELVAVLAAAVAAASGMSSSQFRIVSVQPAQGAGGFNTPAWGHADRLSRPTSIR